MTIAEIINIVLCVLSFLLAVISVFTVVITIRQNNKQLQEMQTERITRDRPVLLIINPSFHIEKPRFFYSPPENEYKHLARHYFRMDLQNLSAFPAASIDISATLRVREGEELLELSACSQRLMIIGANDTNVDISIMFAGDSDLRIFNALRVPDAKHLPRLKVEIHYKNLAGACFKTETAYILVVEDESEPTIKNWHEKIVAERVATKELINALDRLKLDDPKRDELFNKEAEIFSLKLGNEQEALIKCLEDIDKFTIKGITDAQYKKDVAQHIYGRYVHKKPNCE